MKAKRICNNVPLVKGGGYKNPSTGKPSARIAFERRVKKMANFSLDLQTAAFNLKMNQIRGKLRNEVKAITKRSAGRIVTEAKRIVPVDTGRLRDSIQSVTGQDGFASEIIADTDYASFVEFGTSRQAAQPYLRPSFERERPFYVQELTRALKNLR